MGLSRPYAVRFHIERQPFSYIPPTRKINKIKIKKIFVCKPPFILFSYRNVVPTIENVGNAITWSWALLAMAVDVEMLGSIPRRSGRDNSRSCAWPRDDDGRGNQKMKTSDDVIVTIGHHSSVSRHRRRRFFVFSQSAPPARLYILAVYKAARLYNNQNLK
jgi:hypothetical protein